MQRVKIVGVAAFISCKALTHIECRQLERIGSMAANL